MTRYAIRPTHCQQCGTPIEQARTSLRKFCSGACRSRSFYSRDPRGWQMYAVPAVPREPLPMPYVGHPIFDQAREACRLPPSTNGPWDWGQHDMLGDAVVAVIEGTDPLTAVRRWRAAQHHREYKERWATDDEWENFPSA